MREALDQWPFVTAAYAVVIGGTLLLLAWSWLTMRTGERRREKARER